MLNPELIVPGPTEEPVSVRGSVLDRQKLKEMAKDCCALRGWDPVSGLQTSGTLERLGLSNTPSPDMNTRGLVA